MKNEDLFSPEFLKKSPLGWTSLTECTVNRDQFRKIGRVEILESDQVALRRFYKPISSSFGFKDRENHESIE